MPIGDLLGPSAAPADQGSSVNCSCGKARPNRPTISCSKCGTVQHLECIIYTNDMHKSYICSSCQTDSSYVPPTRFKSSAKLQKATDSLELDFNRSEQANKKPKTRSNNPPAAEGSDRHTVIIPARNSRPSVSVRLRRPHADPTSKSNGTSTPEDNADKLTTKDDAAQADEANHQDMENEGAPPSDYYASGQTQHTESLQLCEHCKTAESLRWTSGPSGRKLLCSSCSEAWQSMPAPKLTAQSDEEEDADDTAVTAIPLRTSLNADVPLNWSATAAVTRPFLQDVASSSAAPKAESSLKRKRASRKPVPEPHLEARGTSKHEDPLEAFLNSLNPGLAVAAPVLRKLGMNSRQDIERLHERWWDGFFEQEIRDSGLSPFDEVMLKSKIQRHLDRLPGGTG